MKFSKIIFDIPASVFVSRSMSTDITIDKPFISAIVSKTTGTPLFFARINDPRS